MNPFEPPVDADDAAKRLPLRQRLSAWIAMALGVVMLAWAVTIAAGLYVPRKPVPALLVLIGCGAVMLARGGRLLRRKP